MFRHLQVWFESLKASREAERAKLQSDNTEFLPAVLEVQEQPPNPLGRIVLWVIMAFLAISLAWACIGHIDVVAVAPGRIIPDGRIKTLQAPDQGVVRAIHVRDGQVVREGEALIELDPTLSEAEVAQAREALLVAQIDRARARALLDFAAGAPQPFAPPEGAEAANVETQRFIVAARITNRIGGLRMMRSGAIIAFIGSHVAVSIALLAYHGTPGDAHWTERARRAWPGIGISEGAESQAGIEFRWRAEVFATPHPQLRRVEIQVMDPGDTSHELRRLVAVLAREF